MLDAHYVIIQGQRSEELRPVNIRAKKIPEQLHLWWLGQSGFLIQWLGHHLLIDPCLSDSLTKKYAGTNKPHVHMTERVITRERRDFIDIVTSSHNHTDHLDGKTLIPSWKANPGEACNSLPL